jgi:hypothetical protein
MFDTSQTEELQRPIVDAVCKSLGCELGFTKLFKRLWYTWASKRILFTIKTELDDSINFKRPCFLGSGRSDTSVMGTLVGLFSTMACLAACGVKKATVVEFGDDNISFIADDIPPSKCEITRSYARLGLNAKPEIFDATSDDNVLGAEFLAGTLYPKGSGYSLAPKCGRVLFKLFGAYGTPGTVVSTRLKEKVAALRLSACATPVLSSIIDVLSKVLDVEDVSYEQEHPDVIKPYISQLQPYTTSDLDLFLRHYGISYTDYKHFVCHVSEMVRLGCWEHKVLDKIFACEGYV